MTEILGEALLLSTDKTTTNIKIFVSHQPDVENERLKKLTLMNHDIKTKVQKRKL